MSDTRFDVYFSGQLAPSVDADQAAEQLARLFKTQPARLAPLFTGKPALVKRNLSRAEAVRYRQALSQAGMTSIFREHGAPAPPPASNQTTPAAAAPIRSTTERVTSTTAESISETSFALAPVGSDVLTPEERQQTAPVEVDISGLSLAPAGTELLRPDERIETAAIEVDTSALQIVASGAHEAR